MDNAVRARRISFDQSVDVVVVGSGFAGLAAAIEAKTAGSSVMILEKMKGYGGNSVISDGLVAAAGTKLQKRHGITDSPQRMFQDMLRAGCYLNHPELVRTVVESSNEALEWTIALGARYHDRVDILGGHSVPRSHVAHRTSGASIIKPMLSKCGDLGLAIATGHKMQRLVCDEKGRVRGVQVEKDYKYPVAGSGAPWNIEAGKGVILAAGGYGNDIPFRMTQAPSLNEAVDSTNRASTTAEVLRQAMRIGAMPIHLSWIQLGPWASPDEKGYGVGPGFASYIAFPHGITVDPTTGRRFMNESADRKTRAEAILAVGRPCVCIADRLAVERSDYEITKCLKKGVVHRFPDIPKLAEFYGIPLSPLEETLQNYKTTVEDRGANDAFQRNILPGSAAVEHPPFYAMRVWPKVHHTMGGVQIDVQARVLDLKHRAIQGLFAAGEITGGIHGACRLGSCAITDCLVFGRIAGRSAAQSR